MKRTAGRRDERGFSLIEATITLLLLTVAMALFYEMIIGSLKASMFTESHNDLNVMGQRVTNGIHTEIAQARLVFQEDSTGTAYRSLFTAALPSGVAVRSTSRMPIIDQTNTTFGTDPGPNSITNRTGNSLILVRQLSPISVTWDHDANGATATIQFLADRFQFVYYFLRTNNARNFGGLGYYIEPMQATSQIFANYFQLNGITTNKAQVCTNVRNAGLTMAWDPGKAVSAPAFYNISAAGALSGNAAPTFTVTAKSMLPEFAGGRVSGKMEYSVAPNSSTTFNFLDTVPRYATAASNFPEGLEVQIVGASGSRKVMTRLVLASNYSRNYSSQEATVTSSARGF